MKFHAVRVEGVQGEGEVDSVHRIRPAVRCPALDQDVADIRAPGDGGRIQGGGLARLPCEAQIADLQRRLSAHQVAAPGLVADTTTRASGAACPGSAGSSGPGVIADGSVLLLSHSVRKLGPTGMAPWSPDHDGGRMDDLDGRDLRALLERVRALRAQIAAQAERHRRIWPAEIERAEFHASRANLAHYLALRQHDLRPLQAALQPWGVSSLGRSESRVCTHRRGGARARGAGRDHLRGERGRGGSRRGRRLTPAARKCRGAPRPRARRRARRASWSRSRPSSPSMSTS